MSSMKDALKKAGFATAKAENERQKKFVKEKTKTEKQQEHRNYCEVCDTTQPDVERFNHRNARIDAEWICSNCADKNEILDQFRFTNQSDSARSGRYRRYYGPIKDFSKEPTPPRRNLVSGNGNRMPAQSKKKSKPMSIEDEDKNFNR